MKIITYILMLIFFLSFHKTLEAQHQLRNSVFGNGGILKSSNTFIVSGTLGQAAVGTVSNESGSVQGGFWAQSSGLVTSVDLIPSAAIPEAFHLEQNYPNPFNPVTTIRYALPRKAVVKLVVYNVLGRRVTILVDKEQAAGWHTVAFNASQLASGVYVYHLEAGPFVQSRKMLLLK